MTTKKETEVRRLIVGLYSAFPRATMIGDSALGIWVFALKDYPTKDVRQAVSTWINTKDWPPDSLNKFISAVSGHSFKKRTEPEMPGFNAFSKDYRKEGLNNGPSPEMPDNSHEPATPSWKAKIHWGLIRDISEGKVRCPAAIKKGDIFALGDAEEQWYCAEFNKRLKGGF